MINHLLEKLYKFLFESNWEQTHIDKIIIVMYAIPLVLLFCNSALAYSRDLTPLC